jgi:hypothetical protein
VVHEIRSIEEDQGEDARVACVGKTPSARERERVVRPSQVLEREDLHVGPVDLGRDGLGCRLRVGIGPQRDRKFVEGLGNQGRIACPRFG